MEIIKNGKITTQSEDPTPSGCYHDCDDCSSDACIFNTLRVKTSVSK